MPEPLLRDGTMDVAVGQLQPGASTQEFACEPVLALVMVRDGHRKARARSIHELLDEDWVLNFAPDGESNLLDYQFMRLARRSTSAALCVQSVATLQMMVEQADMCTRSPTILSHVPPFGGRLKPLALREHFEPRQLGIVKRRSSTLSNVAVTFVGQQLPFAQRRKPHSNGRFTFGTCRMPNRSKSATSDVHVSPSVRRLRIALLPFALSRHRMSALAAVG